MSIFCLKIGDGSPPILYLTSHTTAITHHNHTYTPCPFLFPLFQQQSTDFITDFCDIKIISPHDLQAYLGQACTLTVITPAHTKTYVYVLQKIQQESENLTQGQKIYTLTALSPLVKLQQTCGRSFENTCAWDWGSPACGVNTHNYSENITILNIVHEGTYHISPLTHAFWKQASRPFLQTETQKIPVLSLDIQQNFLTIAPHMPLTIGQSYMLYRGCGGQMPECQYYNNQNRFGGFI